MIIIKSQKTIWILIIFVIIIILIKIIPFYNYPFDKTIQNQAQIIIYSTKSLNKSDWLITIDWQTKQIIKINNWLIYIPLVLEFWQKISFAAKEKYVDVHFFIQLTGNIIKIYPQSAIYINDNWTNINIINWNIEYLNLDKNNEIIFQWQIKPFELDIKNNILNNILQYQKNIQKNDIIRLYWWNIILNKTFDYIIRNLITLFSKINPKNFKDNMENYEKFRTYINNIDKTNILWNNLNFKQNEKSNINKDVSNLFYKWLSKITNSF